MFAVMFAGQCPPMGSNVTSEGTPRLFSPLLYQLSYLAEIGEGR